VITVPMDDQFAPREGLQELLAREAIHDVLKRYVRAVDRADAELMLRCYHDDGVDDHGSFRGSASEFAEFVCGERSSRYSATHHFIAAPNVVLQGDVALVDTYCTAHQISVADDAGRRFDYVVGLRYIDRFEDRGTGWLIAHRTAVYDWTYTVPIDEQLARSFEDGWSVGSRDRLDPWYRSGGAARTE
jgi:ketosteroid isomerase-like protein